MERGLCKPIAGMRQGGIFLLYVIDCPESQANLDKVVELMTKPIPWTLGLPLNADGWIGDFFKKD